MHLASHNGSLLPPPFPRPFGSHALKSGELLFSVVPRDLSFTPPLPSAEPEVHPLPPSLSPDHVTSRQRLSLTTHRRPRQPRWRRRQHPNLENTPCNNSSDDLFCGPAGCMNNECKSFRLFFARQLCRVERCSWRFHPHPHSHQRHLPALDPLPRKACVVTLDFYITCCGATSVIDRCWSGLGLTERWGRERLQGGRLAMWVRPAGGRHANKLDVQSEFVFCNLKKKKKKSF